MVVSLEVTPRKASSSDREDAERLPRSARLARADQRAEVRRAPRRPHGRWHDSGERGRAWGPRCVEEGGGHRFGAGHVCDGGSHRSPTHAVAPVGVHLHGVVARVRGRGMGKGLQKRPHLDRAEQRLEGEHSVPVPTMGRDLGRPRLGRHRPRRASTLLRPGAVGRRRGMGPGSHRGGHMAARSAVRRRSAAPICASGIRALLRRTSSRRRCASPPWAAVPTRKPGGVAEEPRRALRCSSAGFEPSDAAHQQLLARADGVAAADLLHQLDRRGAEALPANRAEVGVGRLHVARRLDPAPMPHGAHVVRAAAAAAPCEPGVLERAAYSGSCTIADGRTPRRSSVSIGIVRTPWCLVYVCALKTDPARGR